MDVVDALGGDLDCAGEAKSHVGAPGVVVDGLGKGDDVKAFLAQAVCRLGGTVAAQHEQTIELELVVGMHHGGNLFHAVGFGGIQLLERRAARSQDGSAAREDAAEVCRRHNAKTAVDEALIAILKAIELNGFRGAVGERLDDSSHGGVQRLAVAAAGEKSNPEHGIPRSVFGSYRQRKVYRNSCLFTGV